VLSPETVGKRVGEIARRILHGARPQEIPIRERRQVTPTFDLAVSCAAGVVAETALAAGSIVRFRQFSLWERYRTASFHGQVFGTGSRC